MLVKHACFIWTTLKSKPESARFAQTTNSPALLWEYKEILIRTDRRDCITCMRSACHTNDLFYESVSIFCMITTSRSYIEVIKTVYKTPNNILIGVPVGTAASRDETPCIRSTHNRIAVLRPCRLKEKSHRWNAIGQGILRTKTPVDYMLTRETWLASVSAQLRDR